jgi:hypothetical protein
MPLIVVDLIGISSSSVTVVMALRVRKSSAAPPHNLRRRPV